jgi:ADP-heptose:LPS heptosyltransferase
MRALKQAYPFAQLSLAADPSVRGLAGCIDVVDEVIPWENRRHAFAEIIRFAREIKKYRFDLCVIFNPTRDFHLVSFLAGIPSRVGYNRKWGFLLTRRLNDEKYLGLKHEVEYNLELAALAGGGESVPPLSLTIDERVITRMAACFSQDKDLISVHPFTSDPQKQWPLAHFLALIKKLSASPKIQVAVIGGREERDKNHDFIVSLGSNAVDMVGKTSLVELGAVLKKSSLLISADSGPVHLASCAGTKTIALFRNDLAGKGALRWGPLAKGSIVLEQNNLGNISVEEVFDKARVILND